MSQVSCYLMKVSILILIICAVIGHCRIPEILFEDETTSSHSNAINNNIVDEVEGGICHVEFQVMKRAVGKCMKIGRTVRGCVSGNYVHPFHPECM